MENLADRLRVVRTHFGVSARALSLELGLANNAWSGYERADHSPSAEILTLLAAKGININWLLTGEGPTLQGSTGNMRNLVARAERATVEDLRIGQLALLARRASVELEEKIQRMLAVHSNGCTLIDIVGKVQAEQEVVAIALLKMMDQGLIFAKTLPSDVEVYTLSQPFILNPAFQAEDKASMCLSSMRFIANELSADLIKNPSGSILVNGVASVQDGEQFIKELSQHVKRFIAQSNPGTSQVQLIFAASMRQDNA